MIKCPDCGSTNVEETGILYYGDTEYYCNECKDTFYKDELFDSTCCQEIKEVPKPKRPNVISQESKKEIDYFLNKLKGALMYVGGNFENYDFDKITAYDLIDTCFRNGVKLDCKVEK